MPRMFRACSIRGIRSRLLARENNYCRAAVFSGPRGSAVPAAPPPQSYLPRLIRRPPVPSGAGMEQPPTLPPPPESSGVQEMDPLTRLNSGFEHFREEVYQKNPALFARLAEAQNPKYMVLACADSRVCPSLVFNFRPGEAFTVRNIANMIPPYHYHQTRYSGVGAALQFALLILEVQNIVVVGHSRCGGIEKLMSIEEDGLESDLIDDWVRVCWRAKEKVKAEKSTFTAEDQHTHCEKEAVNVSLQNLMSYPFVRKRVEDKKLKLIGAHYNFVSGSLDTWEI